MSRLAIISTSASMDNGNDGNRKQQQINRKYPPGGSEIFSMGVFDYRDMKLHDLAHHKCIFYRTIGRLADELESTILDMFGPGESMSDD